jgi:hypothetical protein
MAYAGFSLKEISRALLSDASRAGKGASLLACGSSELRMGQD